MFAMTTDPEYEGKQESMRPGDLSADDPAPWPAMDVPPDVALWEAVTWLRGRRAGDSPSSLLARIIAGE